MKFVVLGTSEFALSCTRALLDSNADLSALISMPKDKLPLNSIDIEEFARFYKISYNEIEDVNSDKSINLIKSYEPDYLFLSWPKILKKKALQIPKEFCIGTHPTELPYNRGRHPLHWLIALGIPETKLSFFRMDEGVDTGNILFQVPFSISPEDTIENAVSSMNKAAYEGTKLLYQKLKKDEIEEKEQKYTKTNYWRKRTPHDTVLDLRMPANLISRLVRSYTPPYLCAKLIFGKHVLPISNSRVVDTDLSYEELQRVVPGKVIDICGRNIRVKVDDKIIDLECKTEIPSELLKINHIHPPSKYISEFGDLEGRIG